MRNHHRQQQYHKAQSRKSDRRRLPNAPRLQQRSHKVMGYGSSTRPVLRPNTLVTVRYRVGGVLRDVPYKLVRYDLADEVCKLVTYKARRGKRRRPLSKKQPQRWTWGIVWGVLKLCLLPFIAPFMDG